MPLETRARPPTPDLMLPPAFTLVRLRELGDAFAHAKSIAAEKGAGTLVYVGRFDLAESPPLLMLQIFRSVVDDPVARAAPAPADIIDRAMRADKAYQS